MRVSYRLSLALLAAPLLAATPPVEPYKIPALETVTIDGNPVEWTVAGRTDRSFHIDVLGEADPRPASNPNLSPSVRLAWTPRGLAALYLVHDTTPTESDNIAALGEKDSVELMISDPAHPQQVVQFVIAPGMDPAHRQRRTTLRDYRTDKSHPLTPTIEAASAKTADGYIVEALVPWSDLGLTPALGTRLGMQVVVSDVFAPGQKIRYRWSSTDLAYNNVAFHQPLILADTASDPITLAVRGDYQGFRRYRIGINSNDTQPRKITLQDEAGKELAALAYTGGRAHMDLPYPTAPLGPLTVCADGKVVTHLTPGPAPSRSAALNDLKLVCSSCAFCGSILPTPDVADPFAAEDLLGVYTLSTRYFDAQYNEVTTASKPGRYAAVVHLAGAAGLSTDRIFTLYRYPEKIGWRDPLELSAKDLTFPKEFGIAPAVTARQSTVILDAFKRNLFFNLERRDDGAILLAGLAETAADAPPFVSRTDPGAVNDVYIHTLRQKLDITPSYRYLEHLPPNYAADKDARFPLIIFLHGSGERGDDLNTVKRTGLPAYLARHPEFPAVVISPQCPLGEWWHPLEIHDLIDQALVKYRIDPDRIYMTGLSRGGFGTWSYATWYPSSLAAIVPICGIGDPKDMARLKSLPTWVFHGEADRVVPIGPDRECVEALKAAGAKCNLPPTPASTTTPGPKLTIPPRFIPGFWASPASLINRLTLPGSDAPRQLTAGSHEWSLTVPAPLP